MAKRALSTAGGLLKVIEGFSNILDPAGVKIPCAVINGPNGIQRVLSETGLLTHSLQRFVHMVDQAMPRKGDTIQLPFNDPRALPQPSQ